MSMFNRGAAGVLVIGLAAAPALSQDSVAATPGNSDALSPYTAHVKRYIVDLKPQTSSWDNPFLVGPVLKASRDEDPMFPTQILGALAMSPDQLQSVAFSTRAYYLWTAAGQGVNPTENSAAPAINVTGYDRQFGIAMNDFSSTATNVIGALIGQNDGSDRDRLYVMRVTAMASRQSAGSTDTSTISTGAIDANGSTFIRVDDYNATSAFTVLGENIVRVDAALRSAGSPNNMLNLDAGGGQSNFVTDPTATAILIDAETTTTNTPAGIPASVAGSPLGAILDFAGDYRPDGGAGITSHLDAGIDAHRGNPSFSLLHTGIGVGTVASLARSTAGMPLVDSINLFEVSNTGAVLATDSATLPSPISDGAGFTTNNAGDAQFHQFLSQSSFRGANGQVAVGKSGATLYAAATAIDPTHGEFIAVARFEGGGPTWTVAAYVGKPVLDAMNGASVGAIRSSSPVSISSPALDAFGNVYFVAAFNPTIGPDSVGLFKAVNTPGGYQLELLLETGDSFVGANSLRSYTIDSLTLGDSDSLASGAFHSGNVLQPSIPGTSPTAMSPDAFGGAVVSATITYNNGGTPESYEAVLFVGPGEAGGPVGCDGDADGNGTVDVNDITFVIPRLGNVGAPCTDGDVDGNGVVDVNDITYIVGRLGACQQTGPCT